MKSVRWMLISGALLIYGAAPGWANPQDRGAQGSAQEHKFSDQDRKAAQDYHDQHQDHPAVGFRAQDKLRPDEDAKIRAGAVLDPDLRGRSHPIPADMLHRLPPAPKGHHYVVVGGHVCDVDSGWHISDVIHISL